MKYRVRCGTLYAHPSVDFGVTTISRAKLFATRREAECWITRRTLHPSGASREEYIIEEVP